ncbi:cupin domain-containing protein [Pedobacter gandavensis]|uniref:cupin domain-containing protein n=1 Tax=Pedobacter gandavensis TaxID=2679963 RepID=UPI00292CE0B6|nr:cupin domain-containing protein [Pedobacter gandavensis]
MAPMKCINGITLALFIPVFYACHNPLTDRSPGLKNVTIIFPKGEKNTNGNFTGEVWLKSLVDPDILNETAVGNVTFAPGARSKWHAHPAGQIILVTAGLGYYQEEGQEKRILRKGDVVKCPANIPHWHGASTDSSFVQVAITGRQKGPTKWFASVTDAEYFAKASQ